MKLIFAFAFLAILLNTKDLNYDFGITKEGINWYVVNDGVMGGLSDSDAFLQENSLLFKGNVSLDNNGGFVSLRCPYGDMDFSKFKTVSIKYKNAGQNFAFQLETERMFFRPNYKVLLADSENEWTTASFKLEDFKEYVMGKANGNEITSIKLANVIRFGFINYGKKAGDFEFEIDYIKFEK